MEQVMDRKSQNRVNAQTLRARAKAAGMVSFQTYLTHDEIDEVKLLIAKMRNQKPREINERKINELTDDRNQYRTSSIEYREDLIKSLSGLPKEKQDEIMQLHSICLDFSNLVTSAQERIDRLT